MTDRDDGEPGSGVPERTERTDSGRIVTDSGRHITNRNVVPRGPTGREDSGPREIRLPGSPNLGGHSDEAFDVVTPVAPQPRDVRDEADVTLSHSFEPEEPPPRLTPRRAPTERGFVEPRRRPSTPPPLRDEPIETPSQRSRRLASIVVAATDASETSSQRARRLPIAPPEPSETSSQRVRRRTVPDDTAETPSQRSRRKTVPEPVRRSRTPTGVTAGPVPLALDVALRAGVIVAVLGLGAAGIAQPQAVLRGGIAWLGFLMFVLTGWGWLVGRIARIDDPDAGLRAALGAAGYLAIAGVLIAAGVLTRPVILVLIGLGFAAFAWREATAPVATWQRLRAGFAFVRGNPVLGVFVLALGALAVVRIVGAVAALDRNPWDDDLAYTPLVKRLLDTGDLVEPFSFRRLGAYGGQTALQALGAARGTLANVHLIDKGVGTAVTLLLMLGHARERRTRPLWLGLVAMVVIALPETAINTASYWTAAMMFLALYRCVVAEHWALIGGLAAATCTLRQNFLATVAVFVAGVLIARLAELARTMPLRVAWREERRHWLTVGVAGFVVIAPWWIATYASSHSFLFPLVDGTWNHGLSLKPAVTTWPQELASLVGSVLDPSPIAVIPVLALVLAFASDSRSGRPLTALAIASAAGFVLLVHGFLGTDAFNLWRYAFGFATALAIALVLDLGVEDEEVDVAPPGRWVVLAALVLQLVVAGRGAITGRSRALFDDLREAAALDRHGDPAARAEERRYRAMQAAIPAGERTVVMLDDPALLDFDRNPIANLDTPGFASPGEQLPAFQGAEPLRRYLLGAGYRYAAFVRSERSRYFFRRAFWVERMFSDLELFEIMSAYAVDAIDGFAELATTTQVRYDADGLVVLDLGTPLRPASTRAATGSEPERRGAWVRELADREHLHDVWSLSTRADLRFEDGTGGVKFVDDSVDDPKWYDVTHPHEPARRGTAVLWVQRRAHLRVRGASDMQLGLRARIALGMVNTHPRLDVSLDGELVASAVADATGHYAIAATVPRDRLAGGWHDLYLVFSSIGDPDRDLRDVRVARLEAVEWSPP
ncbi:MAG: hypothetical protein E6J90_20465 [Deltaproteobacteria bacterium]|nr:MAG: hypothetical protein E6J90_20465 [Deltaproteobacteria bacterium]